MPAAVNPPRNANVGPARGTDTRGYLLAVLAGGMLMIGLMLAIVRLLDWYDALPPPQLANSLCVDEKLRFMKDHPPRNPNLLVVGSSVAWRHFNSPAAMKADATARPYNAGLCGQMISQTAQVTRWLLPRLPTVRRVMLIASPVDFQDCSSTPGAGMNLDDADAYVFGGRPAWRYYLRYFDPVGFIGNTRGLSERRTKATDYDTLRMNAFGDGPANPALSRGMHYTQIRTFDPECFRALSTMASSLRSAGLEFTVVLTPVHPDWIERYDADGRVLGKLRATIASATTPVDARFLDEHRLLNRASFYDAIHLRAGATAGFTQAIMTARGPA